MTESRAEEGLRSHLKPHALQNLIELATAHAPEQVEVYEKQMREMYGEKAASATPSAKGEEAEGEGVKA